jgi:hypothetical protein
VRYGPTDVFIFHRGNQHLLAKRVSFASNQASQAVSAENYTPNILRTGYDNVLAHRTSELYSKVAKDEGTVTKVTDDVIQVTYKDGTVDAYGLGLAIGEASGEFHSHTKVTDLKVGDKFNKGDVIGWDRQWFERDLFCPGQVAWKCGKMVRIALTEDSSVFEDSLVISRAFATFPCDLSRTEQITFKPLTIPSDDITFIKLISNFEISNFGVTMELTRCFTNRQP